MQIFNTRWFTSYCQLCRTPSTNNRLCTDCIAQLTYAGLRCVQCGMPLTDHTLSICGACLAHPPAFDRVYSPLIYAPPLNHLISHFKYHGRLELCETFADILITHLNTQNSLLPDCLIPVPLHKNRLIQRGYNQANELAHCLARRLNLPCVKNCIIKTKHTSPQTALTRRARMKNLRNAFSVQNPPQYARVAIVDDVITSATTAAEIARLLKQNGVAWAEVWSIARSQ